MDSRMGEASFDLKHLFPAKYVGLTRACDTEQHGFVELPSRTCAGEYRRQSIFRCDQITLIQASEPPRWRRAEDTPIPGSGNFNRKDKEEVAIKALKELNEVM